MVKKIIIKIRRSRLVSNSLKRLFKVASKLPTKRKTIVFESFLGKQYSDNPKALYLYIKKHFPEYKLYWSIERNNKDKFASMDLNTLPRFGLKWIIIMARAEYWVTNSRLPLWLPKPKGTTYIQTWHGTPLKKLALDMDEVLMPGTNTESYKKNFIFEASKWDYLISPNPYSTEIFRRAFNFNNEIIESGYPRNDRLVNFNNEESIKRLKNKVNIPQDKKVILYAPTWRDNEYYSVGKYKFKIQLDLEKMYKELGSDYIVIFRLHYLVAEILDLSKYKNFTYDFSDYDDINDLYLISDILVTDYSSVFFDYAILKKPILFFVYDIDSYRDHLRGFYFDIEIEAPGPLVKDTESLIKEIENTSKSDFTLSNSYKSFYEKFCSLEKGISSKRVIETIFKTD